MTASDAAATANPGSSSVVRYVDHTYRDFSRYVQDGGDLVKVRILPRGSRSISWSIATISHRLFGTPHYFANAKHKKCDRNFVAKLHRILSDADEQEGHSPRAVAWMVSSRAEGGFMGILFAIERVALCIIED